MPTRSSLCVVDRLLREIAGCRRSSQRAAPHNETAATGCQVQWHSGTTCCRELARQYSRSTRPFLLRRPQALLLLVRGHHILAVDVAPTRLSMACMGNASRITSSGSATPMAPNRCRREQFKPGSWRWHRKDVATTPGDKIALTGPSQPKGARHRARRSNCESRNRDAAEDRTPCPVRDHPADQGCGIRVGEEREAQR